MKRGLYTRLALAGIQKNKKLYLPYILACAGMVMMCYIVSFLQTSPVFGSLPGGDTVQAFLGMGFGVMAVFSLLFLFYTNAFLVRRRKMEFGLYNILGMDKKNLALVLGIESLLVAGMTLLSGLFCGVLFSKFAELGIIKLLNGQADFRFTVSPQSLGYTALLFLGIYLLLYLNTLRQLHLANPIALLHSENTGEKPPKGNALLALLGVLLLAGAYVLAVSIEDPLSAMLWFFVAVILVILATYLLFISGSVTLCRLLQKNKRYYYKTRHFVSVASMRYRMKRNGAGLASICILCTMVLVMLSSTACLYIGKEDSLRQRFPRHFDLDITVETVDALYGDTVRQRTEALDAVCAYHGYAPQNVLSYPTAAFAGYVEDGRVRLDAADFSATPSLGLASYWQVFLLSLEDYNRLVGASETLAADEVIVYTTKDQSLDTETLAVGSAAPRRIRKHAESFVGNGVDAMQVIPTLYVVVPDFAETVAALSKEQAPTLSYIYAFDLACGAETQVALLAEMKAALGEPTAENGEPAAGMSDKGLVDASLEGVASEREFFYGLYGGLFFLGILLGIVFVFAAVLIIYYKQVSEGYEDRSRFEIMQKVGMTRREIRRSVNSQVLTVFFLPLALAGVHLGFAFPLIRKLLLIFSLTNFRLLILVTVCCYLIFALFYTLVYRATSRAYYAIVSARADRST